MTKSDLEAKFEMDWRMLHPDLDLETEHRFHPTRKWRFDFAHLDSRVAVEIEGGHWVSGRHTRGSGFEKDCEKYLQAALRGWVVLRIPGSMIQPDVMDIIAEIMRDRRASSA